MPMGDYYNIPWIISLVARANPKSILDIGVGDGTYGFLIRQYLDIAAERWDKNEWIVKIDGIEIFENYRNPIWDYFYNQVQVCDVRSIVNDLPRYDVILMADVIEHFSKADGKSLLNNLMGKGKLVIISTPNKPYPQSMILANSFEEHLSSWSKSDFDGFHALSIKLKDCNVYAISSDEKTLESLKVNKLPRLTLRKNNSLTKLTNRVLRKVKSFFR